MDTNLTIKLVLYDVVEDLQKIEDKIVIVWLCKQEPWSGERLGRGGREGREGGGGGGEGGRGGGEGGEGGRGGGEGGEGGREGRREGGRRGNDVYRQLSTSTYLHQMHESCTRHHGQSL